MLNLKFLKLSLLLLVSYVTVFVACGAVPPLPRRRPLVLWHGLGDSHSSPGMVEFASRIKEIHPGIFIHSVYIEEDAGKDRDAGFYGNVNHQIELVAEQLKTIPELQRGFDAIGLSQGGQFLRAYVERYNKPPIRNLITFGSQHMGISDIPGCRRFDVVCQLARNAAKRAVYGEWAQENIVQAQYYRDPSKMEQYLTSNHFLADINNEVAEGRNHTYARNLISLEKLVLVLFTEDKTVIPKESAWFGSEEVKEEEETYKLLDGISQEVVNPEYDSPKPQSSIIPMKQQPLYVEDWIGLRTLDERGRISLASCKGEHMQMGDCWEPLVRRYTGSWKY
ncbi:hypothetical protein CVT24_004123 [Panaeolus cyanescens]|uniref:Palmitoyl-protein thioesterase 1 n=1 Tax=Panaeolus cyanescens TaxID=181874 RepID=A0A409Y5Y3_9AGAR|nr:hypothetical protein CVT24_004123 [Panaeolus cyanescens]